MMTDSSICQIRRKKDARIGVCGEVTYTLDSGREGAHDDKVVELPWLIPAVGDLPAEDYPVLFGELWERLVESRVLCEESTLLELLLG